MAFSTNGYLNWGGLIIHETSINFRDDYNGNTLAIDFIKSKDKDKGLGQAMIEFAKNYSKMIGCNGHIVLRAVTFLDKNKIPHIFYRKQQFTTLDKKIDKKLDFFIENKLCATKNDFSSMLMFYPPKQKENILTKISSFCKKLYK